MNKIKKYYKMWLIPLLLVMIMTGCDERIGLTSPPPATTPTVSSTNPANNEVAVPFNQKVTATFSEVMDSATLTTASFTLMQGTSFVSGTVSYVGTTATFAPSTNLAPNTLYIATITTTAKNVAGNALATNYVWSYTTGAAATVTPPTVSATAPANADIGVPINQKIAASFSVAMDASTITAATFTLLQGITPVPGFVSYSGITAIFAPTSNLAPNTAYTATITTGSKDLAGIALVNNYVWSFTTGAGVVVTPPTVLSTIPANADIGVVLNQKLAANFSTTMDASTITTSTFTLKQGATPVSGFVSYSGSTAIFAPSVNLTSNTVYTATITTGAKDLAGNALASNYVWSFTTGADVVIIPPTITFTAPANLEVGVALNQNITATFSTTMDASTITTATFTLMQGTTFVSGTLSFFGKTATYNPSTNLQPTTTYTATITTGAKDLAGNALVSNYVWSFTTGAGVAVIPPTVKSTIPGSAEINVALNQKISAVFSTVMDASSLTASTFTLKQGTTPVSGFVSYSGSTAIFTPSSNLSASKVYTATITTGAKDLAGNALANNYAWNFTTGAGVVVTPPTVQSTIPGTAETNVALNQKITATFSTVMDASTITGATFTLKQGATPISGFVSYSGTIATFIPSSNLSATTVYTATITTGAQDLLGNALAANYVWTFTTGAVEVVTPPTITATSPADADTCVALNKQVTATFSKAMDASTITTAVFTLMEVQGATFISGTVSYVGNIATFKTLTNLKLNTEYTATITTGAYDLTGNTLVNNYTWNFTTVVPYTVSLSSSPALGGATSGGGTFNSCSSVTVIAAPNLGYTFTNWTENGNSVSTNASYTFTLSGNTALIANFTVMQYTVALSANPAAGGTVTQSGTGTYDAGSSVTVTATPKAGYTFTSWKENGNVIPAASASYTFTISGNRTLEANFTLNQYTVTLSTNPLLSGTVAQSGTGTYNSGSSVTVTATPGIGYTFASWKENGIVIPGANAGYTFTISGNRTLEANFSLSQYTVTLLADPLLGGNVFGAGSFNPGTIVTVLTSSKSGYRFVNWTDNGTIVSTRASYTFPLTGNVTLTANFVVGMAGINLRSAANFAVLSGSGVTNTGFTIIYGDVGAFPTPTINGFPPGIVNGTLFTSADPIVGTAIGDLTTAYNEAQGRSLDAISLPGQLGGLTLAPGLYVNSSTSGISGTGPLGILTLDAGGDVNAVWIFKMGSTLITDPGTSIVLAGGARWENIYWSVGTSATIGTTCIFYGNILADQAISIKTGASLRGRALTRIAAVTLDFNVVDKRP
ncbi:MAG: hypothetical protein COT22_07935 [Ignavibacteria bacterium CG08_land_8_20_14_0_20_37_9]|nr:MAG: hypothetical protein COT22_07935 [Ignavibacteria bacterium CG08_land_8_20_14_0_20_37_9]